MLNKVISGGQTGVDIAALRAAKSCGLETGGWIPLGWKTLDGPKPRYGKLYGLQTTDNYEYALRTEWNVKDADATLRIAENWHSPGEKCTLKAIRKFGQAHYDLSVRDLGSFKEAVKVAAWISNLKVETLNVAGNSEQTSPGIEDLTYTFLRDLFQGLRSLICRR